MTVLKHPNRYCLEDLVQTVSGDMIATFVLQRWWLWRILFGVVRVHLRGPGNQAVRADMWHTYPDGTSLPAASVYYVGPSGYAYDRSNEWCAALTAARRQIEWDEKDTQILLEERQ